jgi:hypothetical protein
MRYDASRAGVARDMFVRALVAEGISMYEGYVEPIYLQPLYHAGRARWERRPAGRGWPPYGPGTCPVVERMQSSELIYTDICRSDLTEDDAADVRTAIEKVLRHSDRLVSAHA